MAALLKRVFIFIALMLTTASGAWAQGISDEAPAKQLYAVVSGTAMTLKYGAKPSGATAYDATNASWSDTFCSNITTATVDESCQSYTGTSLAYLFFNMPNLTTINGLTNLNTANVTAMTAMFYYCQALTALDLSGFNTEKVTNMALMFYNCSALTSLDLSSFNTANVTRMQQMFNKCPALTSLDLSSFNTANVTIMNAMFQDCSALTAITVGDGWDTNKVTQSSNMFNGCTKLPNFDSSKTDKTNAHTGTGGYLTAAAPAAPTTYSVTLADGTEDATNWTITPAKAAEGETVTIQYNGTRRIKSITAVQTAAAEEQQEQAVTTATPLTMECLSDGTIKVDIDGTLPTGMQYAVNGGEKKKITTTTTIEGLTTGDKVQFYGVGTSTQNYGNNPIVKIAGGTATVKVYGNIMSLLDEENFATKTDLPNSVNVFYGLFYDNDKLTDASGLLLPAETLTEMCYYSMFAGCSALTAAPELPAETLADYCYVSMFSGCSALTAAPELPAETLADYCYVSMFSGCSKLASVTCKATDISAEFCLYEWLSGAGTDASVTSPTLYVTDTNKFWYNDAFIVTAIQQ